MKKIFTIIFAGSIYFQGYGQLIQASIGAGTQPNQVKIFLRADQTQATAAISTLQFNIGVPATGLVTAPTLTVLSSAAFPSVGAAGWQQNPAYLEGGFWNYNIFTAISPIAANITAATEFEAMEVSFENGNPSVGNVALVTLPDGGTSTLALFYCTGTVNSDGSNLYYAKSGVTVSNGNSYNQPDFVVAGTSTSSATISDVVLPIRFLGVDAVKRDNNALITWTTENESDLTDHYDIERSLNSTSFTKMASVPAKNNGKTTNSYDLTDLNLSSVRSSGIFYYRIKQVDKDGHFLYSAIKSVRLNSKGIAIGIYPNPVREFANVTIDLEQDADANVIITDAGGKQVQNIQMQLFKGPNIKKINMAKLSSGNYMLKVQTLTEIKTIPVVKMNN